MDIWAAVALAIAILLVTIFDPIPAMFVGVCLGVFVYVVAESFGEKLN